MGSFRDRRCSDAISDFTFLQCIRNLDIRFTGLVVHKIVDTAILYYRHPFIHLDKERQSKAKYLV